MYGPLVVAVVVVVAIIFQYYYVYQAMIHFPVVGQKQFTTVACVASTKGGKVAGSNRGCRNNAGPFCTMESPCQPCGFDNDNNANCQKCLGEPIGCEFRPGTGPYCSYNGDVLPCIHCCA